MERGLLSRLAALVAALALIASACADDTETTAPDTSPAPAGETQPAPDGAEADAADAGDDDLVGTDDERVELQRGSGGSWTVEHVRTLEIDDTNAAPVIDRAVADDRAFDDHWLWDWWPVRDRDGAVADLDGWQIAVGLTAPADVLPGQRHDIAELRYLVSQDQGRTWEERGEVFPDAEAEAEGSRQWAGSTMYDPDTGEVYVFYTAAGEGERREVPTVDELRQERADSDDAAEQTSGSIPDSDYVTDDDISYEQRMAVAVGRIEVDADGPAFTDWDRHVILFEGDGELYATTAGTEGGAGEIDAFRDPWYFRDPDTGEEYLLFTATMPEAECDGDGVVGIAQRAGDDDLLTWELLPPLLDAHCVNNELERPHVVIEDGRYYLLFTTHAHTFDDGVEGPEGLYGFVGDGLFGPYEPLNGSGLVLANPADEPYQAYSWMTLANGVVTSFFQYFDLPDDVELDYVGTQDIDFQMERFAGTFAPSVRIEFDGATTRIVEELAPGALAP
jgi:levansucrase